MTKKLDEVQLMLTDDSGLGQIQVDMEAFFEFSFWMAEELEDLVSLWAHRAAPAATRAAALRRPG